MYGMKVLNNATGKMLSTENGIAKCKIIRACEICNRYVR